MTMTSPFPTKTHERKAFILTWIITLFYIAALILALASKADASVWPGDLSPTNQARVNMLEGQEQTGPADYADLMPPAGTYHIVTTEDVRAPDGAVLYAGDDPLEWAIENVDPRAPAADGSPGSGVTVILDGAYDIGKVDRCAGGIFMASNKGRVRILGGQGDTISMTDGSKIEPVLFRGLYIEGSSRAAWITLDSGGPYRVSWEDCTIDGGYNHSTNKAAPNAGAAGGDTKWGFIPHRWAGYAARCNFVRVYREHGMYPHTPSDDLLLYQCLLRRNGRTGAQIVSRDTEGGYAEVQVAVVECVFEDNGLKDGGSSLTVYGVQDVVVLETTFWIGRDAAWAATYQANHPTSKAFSTGHFVNWRDSVDGVPRASPTERIVFDDVAMWSAPGTGYAKALGVTNADLVVVRRRAFVGAGSHPGSSTAVLVHDDLLLDTSTATKVVISGKIKGGG